MSDKVEIRDASGNLLGHFTPQELEEELLYRHADEVFDPEEIRRLLAEQPTGRTLEQILHSLPPPEKP